MDPNPAGSDGRWSRGNRCAGRARISGIKPKTAGQQTPTGGRLGTSLKNTPQLPLRPPRPPPSSAQTANFVSPTLPGFDVFSPAARLPPAHGHFLRQLLRVRLITPFLCRSTRSLRRAQSSLMTGATAAVLGSVRARTAARLSQLHSTVSSQIPLKGPLRDQISPGAPARARARAAAAAPSPPPPCAQELFGIFRKSWLRVLFWDVNTDLCRCQRQLKS